MIPTAMALRSYSWTIVYDADCGFCRWSLAWVLRLDRDRHLRPVALGTPAADELLAGLTEDERNASWHLVSPDGERWSAGAAAAPLLRLLPRGQAPSALVAKIPRLTDRAYRFVAEHRSKFSKVIPESAKRRADGVIAGRSAAPARH